MKDCTFFPDIIDKRLPSDEGSGLKDVRIRSFTAQFRLPSDEGSGLKGFQDTINLSDNRVFPRMREVD